MELYSGAPPSLSVCGVTMWMLVGRSSRVRESEYTEYAVSQLHLVPATLAS